MALTQNGGRCLGYSEVDKDAIHAYCENFGETLQNNFGDIREIEGLPPHDLLTAGVPCQSWSIAGKNLGFDDDRGQLWNDTIYLLQQSQPKAFIFENVKGLVDPRNGKALGYILERIAAAGYHASHHVINSYDYGVSQNRVRIYIVGFRKKKHFQKFCIPPPRIKRKTLDGVLGLGTHKFSAPREPERDLFGEAIPSRAMSLSSKNGFNDYFLFNDLRNGDTTVHSWDLVETSARQKHICYLLLRNRRKSAYGKLDGNPLSLTHFQALDPTVTQEDLDGLVEIEILSQEEYLFAVKKHAGPDLAEGEQQLLECAANGKLVVDDLKSRRTLKLGKIPILKTLETLKEKGFIECVEVRYDFKNTKISTGLFGVNRVFLPSSDIFPTLVASDTNDYVALESIKPINAEDYKRQFLEKIYRKGKFRKITKAEACRIQGFPEDFVLPESRARWMKLIGNSVSVPVIDMLCKAMVETGVFGETNHNRASATPELAGIRSKEGK